MENVRSFLGGVFTYVLYPAVVIGIFAYLVILAIEIVTSARTQLSIIRRSVGALLPVVVFVFLFATEPDAIKELDAIILALSAYLRIVFGILAGLLMMESAKRLLKTNLDAVAGTYALFVSSVVAFLLWAFIGGILGSLNLVLLGFVAAGGLHLMYCGVPRSLEASTYLVLHYPALPQTSGDAVLSAVKGLSNGASWSGIFSSVHMLNSEESPAHVLKTMQPHFPNTARLLVVELSGVATWAGFDEKGSAWLKSISRRCPSGS